ncbi:MAG: hypothetical protein ACRDLS_11395 [Solirubrobacteraceae bacterium]
MERFALSERWCGWKDLDAIFTAARAAMEAGPFDPPVCEVVFDPDFDPFTVYSLEEAAQHLHNHPKVMSMEISLSHIDDDEARIVLEYNGHWLQLNGYGSNWARAPQAYDAARVELALVYGITTFKLPELPYDTVAETRKRLVIEDLEAALGESDDESLKDL